MVELQIVILAVAGSSPVGHPPAAKPREIPKPKSQYPKKIRLIRGRRRIQSCLELGIWSLGFPPQAVACALLKCGFMINPAVLEPTKSSELPEGFWLRLFNNEELRDCDDLEKIVIGCELIAALDAVELLAA
jgi:hypothetical protein